MVAGGQPLNKSRGAVLCAAVVLLFFSTTLAAEPGDSAPQRLSTTGGQEGARWSNTAELKKAAEAGNPKACAQYGDALLNGDGVAKDTVQAMRYLSQAADSGESNAAFRLGKIYDDGELTPKDYPKAFAYYSDAAKGGVAEAQYNLGVMYFSAHGVARDNVEGLAWLIVATKNGAPNDREKQVRARLQKNNRLQQIAAAEQRAAEILKDPAAAIPGAAGYVAPPSAPLPNIGQDVENRLHPAHEPSPPVSLVTPRQTIQNWPSLAELKDEAEQKLPRALWALGKVYLDGDLVPADAARAIGLFEQGAAAGNVDAAYQLGELYSKDTYVKHDDAKVFACFLQAARGKVRPALYNLGACYVNGRGVDKDLVEGLAWLILAKKHDVDPRTEGRIRLELQENDPGKIPLAEKRAEQLERELFPPKTRSVPPAAGS
jgi:TPR repeat protein